MPTINKKCAICEDNYDDAEKTPKRLICGHSFCLPCLSQVEQTGKQCPTCRRDWGPTAAKDLAVCCQLLPEEVSPAEQEQDMLKDYVVKLLDDTNDIKLYIEEYTKKLDIVTRFETNVHTLNENIQSQLSFLTSFLTEKKEHLQMLTDIDKSGDNLDAEALHKMNTVVGKLKENQGWRLNLNISSLFNVARNYEHRGNGDVSGLTDLIANHDIVHGADEHRHVWKITEIPSDSASPAPARRIAGVTPVPEHEDRSPTTIIVAKDPVSLLMNTASNSASEISIRLLHAFWRPTAENAIYDLRQVNGSGRYQLSELWGHVISWGKQPPYLPDSLHTLGLALSSNEGVKLANSVMDNFWETKLVDLNGIPWYIPFKKNKAELKELHLSIARGAVISTALHEQLYGHLAIHIHCVDLADHDLLWFMDVLGVIVNRKKIKTDRVRKLFLPSCGMSTIGLSSLFGGIIFSKFTDIYLDCPSYSADQRKTLDGTGRHWNINIHWNLDELYR